MKNLQDGWSVWPFFSFQGTWTDWHHSLYRTKWQGWWIYLEEEKIVKIYNHYFISEISVLPSNKQNHRLSALQVHPRPLKQVPRDSTHLPKTLIFPLFHTYVTTAMTFFSISTHCFRLMFEYTPNKQSKKKKQEKIKSFIQVTVKLKLSSPFWDHSRRSIKKQRVQPLSLYDTAKM